MVTKEAIVKAFQANKLEFASPASCPHAADGAYKWLMSNNIIRNSNDMTTNGILARSDNLPLVMVNGEQPAKGSRHCCHVYELVDGCIWQLLKVTNSFSVTGGIHHITHCQLDNGSWVLIDWSLGQFKSLPEGVELRLYM